jgi:nucleotide-binding universal stress UspA family protein
MYDTILLPTDGSAAATDAAVHAFSHADRYDATLHVLSVVELSSSLGAAGRDDEKLASRKEQRATAAEELIDEHGHEGVDATVAVEVGSPTRVITEYVTTVGIDLVVMSTEGRSGAERIMFGSITEQVIRDSDAPVLAVQR